MCVWVVACAAVTTRCGCRVALACTKISSKPASSGTESYAGAAVCSWEKDWPLIQGPKGGKMRGWAHNPWWRLAAATTLVSVPQLCQGCPHSVLSDALQSYLESRYLLGKCMLCIFPFFHDQEWCVGGEKSTRLCLQRSSQTTQGTYRGLTSTLTLRVNSNDLLFSSFLLYCFFYFPLYFISPPFYWNEPAFPNNCLGCCCRSVDWILHLS